MPCRVGITTNPQLRRSQWESKVYGLTNWRIIGTHNNRADAQAQESRYAARYGCLSSPGGKNARGPWYVYRFDYTRVRSR